MAAYTYPREDIADFLRILHTGLVDKDGQSAAIRLRDAAAAGYATGGRTDIYKKTQTALYAFLRNKNVSKLFAGSEDHFPIPAMPEKQVSQYDKNGRYETDVKESIAKRRMKKVYEQAQSCGVELF